MPRFKRMLAECAVLFGLLVCAEPLGAVVNQSGSVTPGHAACWTATGVIKDCGSATTPVLTSIGTLGSGPTICANSGPATGAFNRICLSATATAGGIVMTNVGGATGGFTFTLNGVTQGMGTVTLPVTVGDLACFADTSGTLNDCGSSLSTLVVPAANVTYTAPGTGATQVTADSIFDNTIYPEEYGAIGDGTTDDTAAWQKTINAAQTQGKPIKCSAAYGIGPTAAATYGFQITSAVEIIGEGNVSIAGALAYPSCWLKPLSTMSTNKDVIQVRGSGPGVLTSLTLANIRIGDTGFGQRGIYVDTKCTTSCATPANRRWFVNPRFNNLFISGMNSDGFQLDNDVTGALSDPLGGFGLAAFTGGVYGSKINLIKVGCCNIFNGGINMTALPISFEASGVAGNVGSTLQNANIIGAVRLKENGDGWVIVNSEIEIGTASGGSNGAIVDLDGALANVVIRNNELINITASANPTLLQHIRIGSGSTNTMIDGNVFGSNSTQQQASGSLISNAGTGTFIGKQSYDGFVPAAQTITNTGTFTEIAQYGRRAIADTNATATIADYIIAYTTLSAARIVTLPLAVSFTPGRKLCIRDDIGTASSVVTISATRAGTDTIAGSTTLVLVNQPQGESCLESNGVNTWFFPLQYLTGDVTGNAPDGSAIPTVIAAGVVTNAKLANMATATLKGRGTAGTGVPEDIAISSGLAITAGPSLAVSNVSNSLLATMATNTVKGNATSGTATPTDLAVGTCSAATSALNWTTNTGFNCRTFGTAANATLGTSGTTVPLLDGTNTWSAVNSFSTAASGGSPISAISTNPDAVGGPIVRVFRNSASPAANDSIGYFQFTGNSSTGVEREYASMFATIVDHTNTSEDAKLTLATIIAGAAGFRMQVGAGVIIGGSGTDPGANNLLVSGTTASTSKTTGALINAGGFGNAGAIFTDTLSVITMAADTAQTDATVCRVAATGLLYTGTGALGICLGTSGSQFKTAFAPMAAGIDEIMKINLQTYRYQEGYGDGGTRIQYGPTAQDVEAALPDLARHDDKGETINYDSGALLFVGLRAIQQLKADNDNLRARVDALECRVTAGCRK